METSGNSNNAKCNALFKYGALYEIPRRYIQGLWKLHSVQQSMQRIEMLLEVYTMKNLTGRIKDSVCDANGFKNNEEMSASSHLTYSIIFQKLTLLH